MRLFGWELRADRVSEVGRPSGGEVTSRPIRPATSQFRGFEAAMRDRLTSSWAVADTNVNMSLARDLRTMRARSRDFFRNSEYGRKFASMVRVNVVGHSGFTLKVDCRRPDGTPDLADSARIAAAYRRWARAGQYDVTGRLSETQFDQLLVQMVARDGECLIRLVEGGDRGIHHCQLQLLPGHLLDEEHNIDLPGGNRIRMGVEFDGWMKPVAYHIRQQTGTADMHGHASRKYVRVAAAEIIHVFFNEEVDQWRGVPWVHAALRRGKQLDQFEEAALVAANVGASSMGFFQQKDPEAGLPPLADGEGEVAAGGAQEFAAEVAPGEFRVIPDGYEFNKFDPNYPSDAFGPFVTAVQRALATGCLVSYHGLTGDLTQVNFSSIRSGTIEERDMWKVVQTHIIESVKQPVFSWWLKRALMFDPDLRSLPYDKFDKFDAASFFGRRWDWVDPRSDVLASREAVAMGISSRAQIIRERGRDPDEVWAELDAEEQRGMSPPRASASDTLRPNATPPDQED